jgi:hypothetical protein
MRAAQVSLAAAALLFACAAGAVELGTLFYSADERGRLDRLRRGEPPAQVQAEISAPPPRREITGFVIRSDGRGTAFVDGVPVPVDRRNAKLLDPKAVQEGNERKPEELRIERK